MIRIAICDDSKFDLEVMKSVLQDYYMGKNCFCEINTFTSGEELVKTYETYGNQFHLLFLDIYMKGMNGIETATLIRQYDKKLKIVFCTVSMEHAIDSYGVYAYGYLVKPLDIDRIKVLLDQFTKEVLEQDIGYLRIKSEYADYLVALREIVYIESKDKILMIHKLNKEIIKTYGKLSNLEQQLSDQHFIRCHQSYIVNMEHIRSVEKGAFLTIIEEIVPIRVKDYNKYREIYQKYILCNF